MQDLITALQIFLKYGNPMYPTDCEHNELFVWIDPAIVSKEDKKELERLGFTPYEDKDIFHSYRFGDF
jgi:hypothetical protein